MSARGTADDFVEEVVEVDANSGLYLASGIVQALGVALLAPVLVYLYRVVKYRREELPGALRTLAAVAPVLVGILALARTIQQLDVVDHVVSELPLAPPDAEDIAREDQKTLVAALIQLLGSLAAVTLAAVLILLSQNARRSGILTNFVGIIGIIVGALLVLGSLLGSVLGPLPIVQWFFFGALAVLFLDRWPGGRPPAWERGEAVPWPTPQQLREQRGAEAMERRERKRSADPEPEPEEPGDEPAEPAAPAHPRSKKRKKKRRR